MVLLSPIQKDCRCASASFFGYSLFSFGKIPRKITNQLRKPPNDIQSLMIRNNPFLFWKNMFAEVGGELGEITQVDALQSDSGIRA